MIIRDCEEFRSLRFTGCHTLRICDMSCFDAAKRGSFWLYLAALLVMIGQRDRAFGEVNDEDPSVAERLEFFENRIRTVLVDHCYKCHSKDLEEPAGGLRLDTRQGIRKGGLTGPAVVPGDPEESLLLSAIEYGTLQMPPDEKLSSEIVSDFRQWIRDGAHDSRDDEHAADVEAVARVRLAGDGKN